MDMNCEEKWLKKSNRDEARFLSALQHNESKPRLSLCETIPILFLGADFWAHWTTQQTVAMITIGKPEKCDMKMMM